LGRDRNQKINSTYSLSKSNFRQTVITTEYKLSGTTILSETTTGAYNRTIRYIYTNNELIGFEYNGNAYYYRKNLFGDIVEIYDSSNNLVASYTYDAWSNCTFGANVDNIANVNPFRYRGYYYDWETRYYYLQTRYYDAEVGRFLNADSIEYLDPETIHGCNLYAYSLNNPVVLVDFTGTSFEVTIVEGFMLVVSISFCVALLMFGAAALITPALVAVQNAVFTGAFVAGMVAGTGNLIEQAANSENGKIDSIELVTTTAVASVFGGVVGGVGAAVVSVVPQVIVNTGGAILNYFLTTPEEEISEYGFIISVASGFLPMATQDVRFAVSLACDVVVEFLSLLEGFIEGE